MGLKVEIDKFRPGFHRGSDQNTNTKDTAHDRYSIISDG